MKGSIIGIFVTLILILTIPLLFLLSQDSHLLSNKQPEPTPTPATLAFSHGQGVIAGYIYHDNNRNGKREAEEKPFEDISVQMKILKENKTENHTSFDLTTDTYGYFSFRFPSNASESYLIKLILPKGYKTVDSNPLIISNLKANTEKIVEFGLAPTSDILTSPSRKPQPKADPSLTETPKPTIAPSTKP